MKSFGLALLALPLAAPWALSARTAPRTSLQAPLHIVGVERRGLPPYEAADRLYRLDGGEGAGLRMGDHLGVRRPGGGPVGRLRVVELKAEWALAVLEGSSDEAPMKGDLALKAELAPLPALPALRDAASPLPAGPRQPGVEAPAREGLLWFLPDSGELSPAGRAKLAGWVEAWGREGRWSVNVAPVGAASLREARTASLREALHGLGVEATVETTARMAEGPNHAAWVLRRD